MLRTEQKDACTRLHSAAGCLIPVAHVQCGLNCLSHSCILQQRRKCKANILLANVKHSRYRCPHNIILLVHDEEMDTLAFHVPSPSKGMGAPLFSFVIGRFAILQMSSTSPCRTHNDCPEFRRPATEHHSPPQSSPQLLLAVDGRESVDQCGVAFLGLHRFPFFFGVEFVFKTGSLEAACDLEATGLIEAASVAMHDDTSRLLFINPGGCCISHSLTHWLKTTLACRYSPRAASTLLAILKYTVSAAL